ncbi:hypothetical protein [Halalkalibacter sp. APA_J-10(15)]|uniref:hypothetical protein n=1 Tax=Halalkalibacter sp. APA_J-10(15) TaxID=2933805 RepID=UPI001FF17996|nr:hypothetical protein [Halalkalibacter sp. APA_J-10(15)]MCK0470221.1 hypothetical protein [Halalkalibacter sp. APA_J-10(15)]
MNLQHALKYAPHLYFDKKEPFFPCMIGVTEIRKGEVSPSFRRSFIFDDERLDHIIEYAIYFDFDIQHLYELEHVWVYVSKEEDVLDCEASFHGRYFKGLFPDRRNLVNNTHVKLYSQPGKHAFFPDEQFFHFIPDVMTCTDEGAGQDGLTVPFFYKHEQVFQQNVNTNQLIKQYMKRFRFTPSLKFEYFELKDVLFRSWTEVFEEIPRRMNSRLEEMKKG